MDVIWTVAWYEFKLIFRSRVFRLFAVLTALVQIAMVVIFYLLPSFSRWGLRAVPSMIPYASTLLYAMFAGVGGIFVATEFLGRDLSLGTTDTVYYRNFPAPMYLIGKGVGIMMAMLGLMLLMLLLPLTVNVFFLPDTPTTLESYLLYPLLITLPAMLFTMGLSWLVMLLTKSQAVTFMVMVFVFGGTLWADRIIGLHHLLDYPGLRIPALYSDFIGFGDAGRLFMQRGLFALFGIGFMAIAPLLLPRLPQSKAARRISGVLATVSIVCAIVLAGTYLNAFAGDRALRDELRALNHEFGSRPRPTLTACDLDVEHRGDTIAAEAALTIRNDTAGPLNTCLFSLNPGLAVESVAGPNGALPFERNRHLLTVTPSSALAPGDSISLVITYAGTINDRICYLDTPESERTDNSMLSFIPVQRMSGTVGAECVLLTPETLWYPVAGVPYGSTFPELGRKDFPRFSLTVDTKPGMVPISQGLPDTLTDGRIAFHPETPLSQLSLNIAPYQLQSTVIDSITFSVYCLQGHDFYSSFFEDYLEGFPEFVHDQLEEFSTRYYTAYPFDYFTVSEVPVQFSPRPRSWTLAQSNTQPGLMMVNERGIFQQDMPRLIQSLKSLSGRNFTQEEFETILYQNILYGLYNQSYDTDTSNSSSSLSSVFSLSTLYQILSVESDIVHNAFPNYYSFTTNIYSERWPIIDAMLERYLATRERSMVGVIIIGMESFNQSDRANMLLAERNLPEILAANEQTAVNNVVMTAKVQQLFALLMSRIGTEEFELRLEDELIGSQFEPIEFTAFLSELQGGAGDDIGTYLDAWYHATALPICILNDVTQLEIHENEQTFYQLMVTLSNPSPVDGLFQIATATLRIDEQSGRGNYEQQERYVEIPAGEARCVCMIADDPYYNQVSINTLISRNLPSTFSKPIPDPVEDLTVALLDSILTVDRPPMQLEPGVVIVDDISPGCVATMNTKPTWFQKLLFGEKDESEYKPMMIFSPYDEWVRSIDASFYGEYIRSALVKNAGSGDQSITWTAELPENGTYDVYARTAMSMGNVRFSINGSGVQSMAGTFHYTVHHDDGADPIEIQLDSSGDEWSFLGSYFFSAGEAKVVLTDESDGRVVFGDAIKWVKR